MRLRMTNDDRVTLHPIAIAEKRPKGRAMGAALTGRVDSESVETRIA